MDGMKSEHCEQGDSDVDFETLNYGLLTTPRKEWDIVMNVDKSKESNGRIIPDYRTLLESESTNHAEPRLEDCEIVATILYTGPMVLLLFFPFGPCLPFLPSHHALGVQYQIYNIVLRQRPQDGFSALKENRFATTIHCLVSAVTKISCATKVRDGLLLYRGLGGIRLPDSFYKGGKAGFRCFVEMGFMSTTSSKSVAVQYTGIAKGHSFPTLLQVLK